LWVSPGSRKCTCVSMTPGRMCSPAHCQTSPGAGRRRTADGGDLAIAHADVAQRCAVLIDHGRPGHLRRSHKCFGHTAPRCEPALPVSSQRHYLSVRTLCKRPSLAASTEISDENESYAAASILDERAVSTNNRRRMRGKFLDNVITNDVESLKGARSGALSPRC
jgi:hypothetical protein